MALGFSLEEDELLVEEITKHPSLWQLSHAQHKDQRVRDKVWADIAEKVQKPVDACKKRWRNIKDTYVRSKNKRTGSAAQPPTKKGKTWALEEKLAFLKDAQEHRIFSNVDAAENDGAIENPGKAELAELDDIESYAQNSEEPPLSHSPSTFMCHQEMPSQGASFNTLGADNKPPWKNTDRDIFLSSFEKRSAERNELMKKVLSAEEDVDEIDLFFQSFAKSIKKLSRPLQRRAQIESLKMLCELEEEVSQPSCLHSTFGYHSSQCTTSSPGSVSIENKSQFASTTPRLTYSEPFRCFP